MGKLNDIPDVMLLERRIQQITGLKVKSASLTPILVTDTERLKTEFPCWKTIRVSGYVRAGAKSLDEVEPSTYITDTGVTMMTPEGVRLSYMIPAERTYKLEESTRVHRTMGGFLGLQEIGRETVTEKQWRMNEDMLRLELDQTLRELKASSLGRAAQLIQDYKMQNCFTQNRQGDLRRLAEAYVTVGLDHTLLRLYNMPPARVMTVEESKHLPDKLEVPICKTSSEWVEYFKKESARDEERSISETGRGSDHSMQEPPVQEG
jgi:hypothetical protein